MKSMAVVLRVLTEMGLAPFRDVAWMVCELAMRRYGGRSTGSGVHEHVSGKTRLSSKQSSLKYVCGGMVKMGFLFVHVPFLALQERLSG